MPNANKRMNGLIQPAGMLLLAVLVACVGCQGQSRDAPLMEAVPDVERGAEIEMSDESKAALLEKVGGDCPAPGSRNGCTAGDYDLELIPGCGEQGFFAGVSNDEGADVYDKAPPDDIRRSAHLSKGQIVCINAIARAGQQPMYYFVPSSSIKGCSGNALCELYGDRPVRIFGDADSATGDGSMSRASGWLDAESLDVFSLGM